MARRLDFWRSEDTFAWLDGQEADVFASYFILGSVKALVEELGQRRQPTGLSLPTFYAWLHDLDGRWERFEEVRESRAYTTAEEGYAYAENAEQNTANRDRLRFEGKMRAAEHMNRNAFGKRPDVQVAIGVGGEWASALDGVLGIVANTQFSHSSNEIAQTRQSSSARPTANAVTRALDSGTILGTLPSGEPEQG